MKIRLALSSFLVVVFMIWLVAIAGFYFSKNSLQALTTERVKYAAVQRTALYKQIWDGAIHSELTRLQTVASLPAVVQGVLQPETHTEALQLTITNALKKNTRFTAIVVDFEGNLLSEVSYGEKLNGDFTEILPRILDGSDQFRIQFQQSGSSGNVQFIVPIERHAGRQSWVEGAIVARLTVESIHESIKPEHRHVDGRVVLASGQTEYYSVGSTANNEVLPIEADIASTEAKLRFYAQIGVEKALLNERLTALAVNIGAALAICMGIGYILINRLLHHPLAVFLDAIEAGNNNGHAEPIKSGSRITEIRQLTDRYNDMMQEISARQEELSDFNKSLRIKVISQSREIAAMHTAREKMKFLSGVSHELRTPLHAILGFTRLGLEKSRVDGQSTMERYLSKIDRNASTLLTLVDDILDLSKTRSNTEAENKSKACIFKLVSDVVEEMEAYTEEASIAVTISNRSPDLCVNVNGARIQQVIRNLLSNAIRYSSADTTIEIEILNRNRKCEVRILDMGVGIPPEELENIFDAFTQSSRTDKLSGGTGLGLAISRAIIANHGGDLLASNRPGVGACFTFTLPLYDGAHVAAA